MFATAQPRLQVLVHDGRAYIRHLGPFGQPAHRGCPGPAVLAAPASELARLRGRAAESDGVFVADMPAAAQENQIYDAYADAVEATPGDEQRYPAISVVGPGTGSRRWCTDCGC